MRASLLLPHRDILLASSSFTGQNIDANNDGTALVLRCPKAGTIDRIGARINTSTSAPTYRFGVEGVSGRAPDGAYLASGNAYVDVAAPGTGFAWRSLGTPVAVTEGQLIAGTIRYQSGTIDGTHLINVSHSVSTLHSSSRFPFAANMTAGLWNIASTLPIMALRYSDGEVALRCTGCPADSLTNNTTWNSGSNPLYLGTKFVPSIQCRLRGVDVGLRPGAGADFTVHLFEDSNTTPVASQAIDVDNDWQAVSGWGIARLHLPAYTLRAGHIYRLLLEPMTVTNPTTLVHATFTDADALAAYFGNLAGCTADSSEVFTDYDNGTNGYRAYPVIPFVDQIESLIHPRRAA